MHAHASPAPSSPLKTPLHTLIRVRNNQRRHRQRRQEYIRSLEQRLAAAEERASQLQTENDVLRSELSSQEFPGQTTPGNAPSATRLTTDLHPSNADELLADDAIHFHGLVPGSNLTHSIPVFQPDPTLQQFPAQWDAVMPATGLSVASLSYPTDARPAEACLSASCCSHLASGPTCSVLPAEDRLDDYQVPFYHSVTAFVTASTTTLCSQAYILIRQCNRRGLSMEVVQSWLWPGFSNGEDALVNGCRVDSGLLQGLLEYISGGVEMAQH